MAMILNSRLFHSLIYLLCSFIVTGCLNADGLYQQRYEYKFPKLVGAITNKLDNSSIQSVAIYKILKLDGNQDELGNYLIEDLSTLLSKQKRNYEIIDRSKFEELLDEHSLGRTGFIEQSSVSELGKLVGIDAIVEGRYSLGYRTIKVWINVIGIEKGNVVLSETSEMEIDNDLLKLSSYN